MTNRETESTGEYVKRVTAAFDHRVPETEPPRWWTPMLSLCALIAALAILGAWFA